MKSEMCSLASEQPKGAATVYRVSYRWGNMHLLLFHFSVWLPSSKKKYFHSFYLSYIAVETKTSLMIQFFLLIIWENRQLCVGVILSLSGILLEKERLQSISKIENNLLKSERQRFQEKIFVIRTWAPFYTSDLPFLCTGNDFFPT